MSKRTIVGTLMELSRGLVSEYDVVELLTRLTSSGAELLDASAGLMLADARGVLRLMASSPGHTDHLALFDPQLGDGPLADSYQRRVSIAVRDLGSDSQRWPRFQQVARDVGVTSVHAAPVRLGGKVLGALGLLGTDPGAFRHDDLALAQTFADLASVAIVNDRSSADLLALDSRLQDALTSRIVVEQAKGVIARGAGIDTNAAFDWLRACSRDHGRRLSEVAIDIVHHDVTVRAVVEHARATG